MQSNIINNDQKGLIVARVSGGSQADTEPTFTVREEAGCDVRASKHADDPSTEPPASYNSVFRPVITLALVFCLTGSLRRVPQS